MSDTAGINIASPNAVDPSAVGTGTVDKSQKSTLEAFKEKLIGIKDFVLAHKEGCGNLGQIAGSAGLALGAAALVFSGIAASLTVGGIPLAIPLLVAGGILFAGGSALKVADQIGKEGDTRSIGEKIENFFKETFKNMMVGGAIGAVAAVPLAFFSATEIILALPFVAATVDFLKSDESNKEEALNRVKGTAPSRIKKPLEILIKAIKGTDKVCHTVEKKIGTFESKKPEQTTDNSTPVATAEDTGENSDK